jgi:hypothetical protein
MGAGALHEDDARDASGDRLAVGTAVRARTLHGFIHATREVLGERAYERVLTEVSPHVLEGLELDGDAWVPAEHVAAWCDASLRSVEPKTLPAYVDSMMSHGFGRVRRVLLQIATPHGVLRRASEIWREDFTSGRLVAYATSPNTAIVTLYDHVFLASPLLRAVLAESFRSTLQLSGGQDATAEHSAEGDGPLLVRLSWS